MLSHIRWLLHRHIFCSSSSTLLRFLNLQMILSATFFIGCFRFHRRAYFGRHEVVTYLSHRCEKTGQYYQKWNKYHNMISCSGRGYRPGLLGQVTLKDLNANEAIIGTNTYIYDLYAYFMTLYIMSCVKRSYV